MVGARDARDFFISYRAADQAWAEWIAWELEAAGYTVFVQAWDFRPGQNFVQQMQQGASACSRTVAVLTPAYFESGFTRAEWYSAFAKDAVGEAGLLLPVRVEECDVEGLLGQIIYIDLMGLGKAEAREWLLTGVTGARAKPSRSPGFPGLGLPEERSEPAFPAAPPSVAHAPPAMGAAGENALNPPQPSRPWRKNAAETSRNGTSSNESLNAALDAATDDLSKGLGSLSADDINQLVNKQFHSPDEQMEITGGVHFTVYHPKEVKPEVWYTLLAYVHILKMQSTVEADAKQRLEAPHGHRTAKATHSICRGAKITVSPELPGCRFNPTSMRLFWLEDWHRVEFRLQAQHDFADCELGKAVNGRVAFYVESLLVGEVPIWTCISDEADTMAADAPASTASAKPYEAIFVSYAHEDSIVVDRLGKAYKVLGMEFLRDVEALRSGDKWNPALLAMIERANIFQLYWSRAAKRSRYVRQEWRHALKQEKSHFIRPFYWQVPMPQPPRELVQLHFSYFELEN